VNTHLPQAPGGRTAPAVPEALLDSGAAVDLLFTDVVMPGALRSPELDPGDILLTGLGLPGMSGSALAQAARTRLPGLPVIFASGRAVAPIEGLPAQALVKPFTLEALGGALERARAGQEGR
jgi:DNA-binding response OmpR family regulator